MMLQALYELAEREQLMADPDFQLKPITYLVRVGDGGEWLGLQSTRTQPETGEDGKKKGKPRAKSFPVPREGSRTSGDRAFFLFDKAEYVFGIDPTLGREPEKLATRLGLFREKVDACLAATDDPGVRAVSLLLARVASGELEIELPEDCASNDLFAFLYAPDIDLLVHRRPAVQKYWKGLRQQAGGELGDDPVRCLVTGEPCVPVSKHPPLKNVPGGSTSGIALVSFNSNAFESYGWNGNDNAAISRQGSEAFSTALNRLLHPAFPNPAEPGTTLPERRLRLSADTVACYWAKGAGGEALEDYFGGLVEADPDQVAELYQGVWKGRRIRLEEPGQFFILTLTGTQGRAIVRDWLETSAQEVADHLADHFRDLKIAWNTRPAKGKPPLPALGLLTLVRSLAFQGDLDRIPDSLAAGLLRSALAGTAYPLTLMQRAIERSRAEIGGDGWADSLRRDARAALIKGVLNRRRAQNPETTPYPEITVTMDPNNSQDGYLLGRLMAVLELMQQTALGDINASVVDRYFGAASATPGTVFPRLLRTFRHHVRKARDGADEQASKRAGWLDHQADRILSGFHGEKRATINAWLRYGTREMPTLPRSAFPTYLPLEQQGLFILGYHHQRHFFFMSKEERATWEAEYGPDAPPTDSAEEAGVDVELS